MASFSYDHTTGQDTAHKLSQEQSQLRANQMQDLYNGNVPGLLQSTSRIRDLQQYLRQYGADPLSIHVLPKSRMSSSSHG